MIGRLPVEEVQPIHIDDVITEIVNAGVGAGANVLSFGRFQNADGFAAALA